MKTILLIPVLLASGQILAHDFKNLKLKTTLEERASLLEQIAKSQSSTKENRAISLDRQIQQLQKSDNGLRQALGLPQGSLLGNGASSFKATYTNHDDHSSVLYEEILKTLQGNFQQIGSSQTESILQYNHRFNLGESNFSGFQWQKPMGSFSIAVNRQVTPNLFGMNYIVQDIFVVNIDAVTFLNKLSESDLIDINAAQLRAFAGVTFKRRYEYFHFARSFEEGLTSDFSKLFLTFMQFTPEKIVNLEQYALMKRQDEMGFNAGGFVQSPSWYGFSANAGVLTSYDNLSSLLVQSVGPNDHVKNGEFLRISSSKKESAKVSASAGVQLDFFEILKITLLSFDLEYEYAWAHEYHLSFYEKDRPKLADWDEFKKLITLKPINIEAMKDNIVQVDQRKDENLQSDVNFLILGAGIKSKLEQVKIVKDNKVTTFYRDNVDTYTKIQSPLSRIFGEIVKAIFKISSLVDNLIERTDHLAIEYEAEGDIHNYKVSGTDKFSLEFGHQLNLADTKGSINKYYRDEAVNFMVMRTELPNNVISMINREELVGPIALSTSIRILAPGLDNFHKLTDNSVYYLSAYACRADNPNEWGIEESRKLLLQGYKMVKYRFLWWSWWGKQSITKKRGHDCTKNLGQKYVEYIGPYRQYGTFDLDKFKHFISDFYVKANSYEYLRSLFGENNVFVNGRLAAYTKDKFPYETYFKAGDFVGLGVIDNKQRENGVSRIPASISSE